VLYASSHKADAVWKPMEGAVNVQGTGGNIQLTDRVPYGETRYYRLQTRPSSPRMKASH
jgi:hypothetical protein